MSEIQDFFCSLDEFIIKVEALECEIIKGVFDSQKYKMPKSKNEKYGFDYYWYGADVYITEDNVSNYTGGKLICITPYAIPVSAIFFWCVQNHNGVIDHMNKYGFYDHLAEMVNKAHLNDPENFKIIDIQLVVINAIKEKLSEWKLKAIYYLKDYLRSEFSNIYGDPFLNPHGWEIKTFSDLGVWISVKSTEDGIADYFENEISRYNFNPLYHRFSNDLIEIPMPKSELRLKDNEFPVGALIVGMRGGNVLSVSKLKDNFFSGNKNVCLISNEVVNVDWLLFHITYNKEWYFSQLTGVRKKYLNIKHIKEFKIPLPPIEYQMKFEAIVKGFRGRFR